MTKYKIIAVVAVLLVCVAASVIPGPVTLSDIPLSRQVTAIVPSSGYEPISLFGGNTPVGYAYWDVSTTDQALVITSLRSTSGNFNASNIYVKINGLETRIVQLLAAEGLVTPIIIPPHSLARLCHDAINNSSPTNTIYHMSITGYALYPNEF